MIPADDDVAFVSVLLMSMTPEERAQVVAAASRLADDLLAAIQAEMDK